MLSSQKTETKPWHHFFLKKQIVQCDSNMVVLEEGSTVIYSGPVSP